MSVHRYVLYLLIFFLPTQLGLHMWPDWSLVLGRRIDYLSPTLFFTDILVGLLFITWMADLWRNRKRIEIHKKIKTLAPLFSIIPLLLVFAVCNIWFASSRHVAFYTWMKLLECIFLGWYIVQTKPNIFSLTRILSLAIIYSSILAIVQFLLQSSVGGVLWFLGERTFTQASAGIAKVSFCIPFLSGCPLLMRPYGTFSHPNVLGGFLAVILPLLIATYHNETRTALYVWVRRIAIALGSIALILSFSRSAWIVGGLAISWVLLKHKRRFGIMHGLSIVSIVCLCAWVVLSFTPESESVVVRGELNQAAVRIWESTPLIGVGLGNFLVALPSFLPSRIIYFLQPVHNIYLLLLSEIGIVGYVVMVLFAVYIIRVVKPVWNSTACISLCVLVALGLVDHYLFTLQQGRLLLVLVISLFLLPRPKW